MASRSGDLSVIADRYAGALFELARESKSLPDVEHDLDILKSSMSHNAELRQLVSSPMFTVDQQQSGLRPLLEQSRISPVVRDFVLLLVKRRRLTALESVIASFKRFSARERGEIETRVTSAVPLTETQKQTLIEVLRQQLGKTPVLTVAVDPELLGGLVVQAGSRMIDTSLRAKLRRLESAMKEAA